MGQILYRSVVPSKNGVTGVIVTPEELFDPQGYTRHAKPVRNFFVYDDDNCYNPIGFSPYRSINLGCADNIVDKSRMTFYTGILR